MKTLQMIKMRSSDQHINIKNVENIKIIYYSVSFTWSLGQCSSPTNKQLTFTYILENFLFLKKYLWRIRIPFVPLDIPSKKMLV